MSTSTVGICCACRSDLQMTRGETRDFCVLLSGFYLRRWKNERESHEWGRCLMFKGYNEVLHAHLAKVLATGWLSGETENAILVKLRKLSE